MKKYRVFLSVVMMTALLAAATSAWAATAKGSSGQTETAAETEASEIETQASEPQTETVGPETQVPGQQTETAAPQTQEAGTKIEGEGYLTPQEALAAYIKGLQDNDFDEMMSVFAIESVAVNYDLARMVERTRTYSASFGMIPNTDDLSVRLNIESRRKLAADIIKAHYLVLTESPLMEEGNYYEPKILSDEYESAQALVDELFIPSNGELLKTIRFEDEYFSPAVLCTNYMNSNNLANIDRQAEVVHAQGMTSVAARIYCNDKPYMLLMDAIQYGTKWYLYTGSGNLANMLGVDISHQGLVPMDFLEQ